MPAPLASMLVLGLELYGAIGLVFAVPFVTRGVNRVDPRASAAGWGFRLLILPGSVLFWPLLATRWVRAELAR